MLLQIDPFFAETIFFLPKKNAFSVSPGHLHLVLGDEDVDAVETALEASNTQPTSRLPTKEDVCVLKLSNKLLQPENFRETSPGATLAGWRRCGAERGRRPPAAEGNRRQRRQEQRAASRRWRWRCLTLRSCQRCLFPLSASVDQPQLPGWSGIWRRICNMFLQCWEYNMKTQEMLTDSSFQSNFLKISPLEKEEKIILRWQRPLIGWLSKLDDSFTWEYFPRQVD